MADQTTTIASFPTGFATLAGLVYAVVATQTKIWPHTCWSRLSGFFSRSVVNPDDRKEQGQIVEIAICRDPTKIYECACYALARRTTKWLRKYSIDSAKPDARLAKHIAVLHFIAWQQRSGSLQADWTTAEAPPTKPPTDSVELEAINSSTRPGPAVPREDIGIPILVKFRDYERNFGPEESQLTLTAQTVIDSINDAVNLNAKDAKAIRDRVLFNSSLQTSLPSTICAQISAPWDVLATELGYKAIEVIFAAGIILGSTGGTWLALTLASMFPQRIAAGMYSSSFGQVLRPSKDDFTEYIFTEPGTIWSDDNSGYCIRPTLRWAWWDDSRRNGVGYFVQWVPLSLLNWKKRQLRDSLFPDSYRQTVDTVRYVVLGLQPFIIPVCLWRLLTQWSKHKGPLPRWRKVFLSLYMVIWALCIVCVVIGQKDFVK